MKYHSLLGKLLLVRGVGVSHILGLGVCTVGGVTGRHALWDAKSGVDRLVVSLASMYLIIKISSIPSKHSSVSRFILPSRTSTTSSYTGLQARSRKRGHLRLL